MKSVSELNSLTVGAVILSALPEGTLRIYGKDLSELDKLIKGIQPESNFSKSPIAAWQVPPALPYDLFAVCGYLIQTSGLMSFYEPDPYKDPFISPGDPLQVTLSIAERKKCEEVGKQWLNSEGEIPIDVRSMWQSLLSWWNSPVRATEYQRFHKALDESKPCPKWWNYILKLFIIADEACDGVGHVYYGQERGLPFIHKYSMIRLNSSRAKDMPLTNKKKLLRMGSQVATYASSVDPGVICVQPKVRVSRVGCTLRNLSRNLSLTGPIAGVRCHWQQLAGEPKVEDNEGLDILLIPLPYEINAKQFKPCGEQNSATSDVADYPNWGKFEIYQEWLEDKREIKKLVQDLIKEAKKDVEIVNGIVFPELSLNFKIFRYLCKAVVEIEPNIEFMIAGTSSNCEEENANCVMTAIWENSITNGGNEGEKISISRLNSQRKHHRWRLERNQLTDYALAGQLSPEKDWWEDHQIGQREISFFQFRKSSVFASLICEDLARSDPVHEVIRSVAPNLLFSFLLDGPQISQRWSSRYASALADDPGTSVLTFTSYGLIKRVNENGCYAHSNSVGLWKDEAGVLREINLPEDAKGILLSLSATTTTDVTIDGRVKYDAKSWRFNSQIPLYLS